MYWTIIISLFDELHTLFDRMDLNERKIGQEQTY